MGSKGGQTVGYHYLMTIFAGLGRGSLNELVEIRAQEKTAWAGSATDDTPQAVNAPELFGGEEKEGGVQGAFRFLSGAPTQVLPGAASLFVGSRGPVKTTTIPGLKSLLDGDVPEFRGFASVVFDGLVASINPYVKEWKFRVRRSTAGWFGDAPWYPDKAIIRLGGGTIHGMNPAHIIYECYTNPEWGKGEPPESMDEDSFIYAANKFCSEAFGLCIPWYRQEDVDPFIQHVCDTVGAVVYEDRRTGMTSIRLMRDDYDPETIPHFDLDTGLISVEEDDSGSSEQVNEVVLTGHDPITDTDFEVRAQNIAAWHAHGGPISRSIEFKGIPTRDLLGRKAQQELRLLSAGLKKVRVRFDRRAWQIKPGSVVSISEPTKGIANMVIRIGEITEGKAGKGEIVAKAMEDVYALPTTTFTSAVTSEWTPPTQDATAAAAERAVEMGYRDLLLLIGEAELVRLDNTDAALGMLAVSPGSGSYLYDLATKADGETDYTIRTGADYTASATLVDPIGPLDTAITLANLVELDDTSVGEVLRIDDEEVLLTTLDTVTGAATIERGCTDTLPATHAAGVRVWSVDDDLVSDRREYTAGETVSAKVLPRTSSQVLDLADAAELTVTMIGRHALPFPPADLKVDGTSIYLLVGEHTEPVFTWAHRDRVLQEDVAISHTEASVGPEAGTTYTVRVLDPADDTLIREETGIDAVTWTYTLAMQAADVPPNIVNIEFESVRDGLISWQKYAFSVILNGGYGLGYGLNYGGG